jgi:uncharacterized damage-inducible protein DinB
MTSHATQLSNRDFFIRRWHEEYPVFVEVCEALPPARLDYRPDPASRSAGELVALLVSVEQSCLELCKTGRSSYSNGLRWHTSGGPLPLDEMIAAYKDSHRDLTYVLSSLDDATWNYPAWLTVGDQEIVLKDTVGGLLWLSLFDAVHHRGQLSSYIRPMGGKVPSIYGPSADTPVRG